MEKEKTGKKVHSFKRLCNVQMKNQQMHFNQRGIHVTYEVGLGRGDPEPVVAG